MEDADFTELCGSALPNPVRCNVVIYIGPAPFVFVLVEAGKLGTSDCATAPLFSTKRGLPEEEPVAILDKYLIRSGKFVTVQPYRDVFQD